jgi:uncharacterized membrane protein
MKKSMIIILGTIMIISLVAVGNFLALSYANFNTSAKSDEQIVGDTTQIPNPFIDCTTLEDAQKLAGFTMTIPDAMPEGYSKTAIRAVKNKMIEVIYLNGDSEIRIRKAIGSEDISGDYAVYNETVETEIGNVKVTMNGNNGKVNVAIWSEGVNVFSITVNCGGTGLDSSIIRTMVDAVK